MMTPQEAEGHVFPKASFGGYNMPQVDAFLDNLIANYRELFQENASLKGKLKVLVDKVEEYRNTEEAMRHALVSAQQMASQIEEDAKTKSEAIITDATAQSLEALAEIKQQISTEEGRLAAVQATFAHFLTDVRALCERPVRYLDAVPQTVGAAAGKIDRIPESEQVRITEPAQGTDGFEATQLFSL